MQSKMLLFITIILLCWHRVHSNDFLAQFQAEIDQLPNDLDTLILHIQRNLNPKSEESSTIQPIRLCVGTSEEYLEFWSIANSFDENVDYPSVEIVQSTDCNEGDEIDKLKLWILQIKNDFYDVLKKPAWSNDYIELKQSYEHKLTKYSKYIDEVTKKVVSDNGKTTITSLKIEYKSLEAKIRSFFDTLQRKKRIENEKSAALCVAELMANQLDNAIKIFNDIAEERLARQIIMQAYENEDLFQRLFDFIQLLGDSPATHYAYLGLFMKMASKGRWKHINSLILLSGIEKHKGSELETMRNVLQKKLRPFFQTGDYTDFFAAVNTRISTPSDFGQGIMPTFLHGAYNRDVNNVSKILDMKSKFYYMRHKLYLIDTLITEMKIEDHTNKPEFLMVLSDLVDLKATLSKEPNENDKKILGQVYDNVPHNLLALMNPKLCIQHSQTGKFMYAGALDTAATNSLRQIFTSDQFDETFNFEADFLDQGRTIMLKNIRFGEYAYAVDGDDSKAPRKMILKTGDLKADKRANFVIEGVDSINVRIRNVHYGEYLFESAGEDKSFVHLESQTSENGLWRLVSCPVSQ